MSSFEATARAAPMRRDTPEFVAYSLSLARGEFPTPAPYADDHTVSVGNLHDPIPIERGAQPEREFTVREDIRRQRKGLIAHLVFALHFTFVTESPLAREAPLDQHHRG